MIIAPLPFNKQKNQSSRTFRFVELLLAAHAGRRTTLDSEKQTSRRAINAGQLGRSSISSTAESVDQ